MICWIATEKILRAGTSFLGSKKGVYNYFTYMLIKKDVKTDIQDNQEWNKQTWKKLQACKQCLRTIFEKIVDIFG